MQENALTEKYIHTLRGVSKRGISQLELQVVDWKSSLIKKKTIIKYTFRNKLGTLSIIPIISFTNT